MCVRQQGGLVQVAQKWWAPLEAEQPDLPKVKAALPRRHDDLDVLHRLMKAVAWIVFLPKRTDLRPTD
jgi:hypothetical protein